jgi:hypothetical protein
MGWGPHFNDQGGLFVERVSVAAASNSIEVFVGTIGDTTALPFDRFDQISVTNSSLANSHKRHPILLAIKDGWILASRLHENGFDSQGRYTRAPNLNFCFGRFYCEGSTAPRCRYSILTMADCPMARKQWAGQNRSDY